MATCSARYSKSKIRGQKHPRREPTENIFSDLKIIKFTYRNTYSTGKFIYKFYKENVPEIFTSFFQCNSSVHGYSSRQSEYIHLPLVRSILS